MIRCAIASGPRLDRVWTDTKRKSQTRFGCSQIKQISMTHPLVKTQLAQVVSSLKSSRLSDSVKESGV